jgi:hypothetical protein
MKQPKERGIDAGEFKAHCLQLIDEVSHSRVPIIVTKPGKPMPTKVAPGVILHMHLWVWLNIGRSELSEYSISRIEQAAVV